MLKISSVNINHSRTAFKGNLLNSAQAQAVSKIKSANFSKMTAPIAGASIAAATAVAANALLSNNQHYKTSLGCDYDAMSGNLNFKVASKNAEHINLYIFDKPVDGKVLNYRNGKKR